MRIKSIKIRVSEIWRNRLFLIVKILVAAGLITFLFTSGQLDFTVILRSYVHVVSLLFGALCCTLAIVTPIFRWWILAQVQKLPLGWMDALRLAMIGYFFNLLIPGGTGGDVIRAGYSLRECPERKAQALTIAFFDRGFGVHALLVLGVVVIFIYPPLFNNHPDLKPFLLLIAGILIIGTMAFFLLIWKRTNKTMIHVCGRLIGGADAWHEAIKLYREQPGKLFGAYLFSIGNAIFNVLLIHFMMLAVGSTPTVIESLTVAPLVILANTLPFTPGGIGVAEGASAGLYALIGVTGGANGMLLARFFIILFSLLGLPFYLLNKRTIGKISVSH